MRNENSVGFQVREISRLIDRAMFIKSMENGADKITASHGWMMDYLYHNRDREIYQKTMEQEFHMSKSTVTSVVQAMEKSGYITRVGVEHDARLKKIVLTPAGEQFYRDSQRFILEVEREIQGDISPEEMASFMKTINQMRQNLLEGFPGDKKHKKETIQEEKTC